VLVRRKKESLKVAFEGLQSKINVLDMQNALMHYQVQVIRSL